MCGIPEIRGVSVAGCGGNGGLGTFAAALAELGRGKFLIAVTGKKNEEVNE